MGGWHWAALGFAAWEQLAGLGLALGLLAWFSRRWAVERPALRWLGDRAFGVYVLHAPVLIAFTMLFRPLESAVHPLALAVLLSAVALSVSFVLADLARRVPGLRAIL
jgi:peptidoglycan/LPS O-acetylase OafA/YrhL